MPSPLPIVPIHTHKKRYIDLLLLGDEQESMIDRYLDRGDLFVWFKHEQAIAVCVTTQEAPEVFEIKNIAVHPDFQRRGYGRRLIAFVKERYRPLAHTLLVGTGDSPLTLPFYKQCGFVYSHRIADFFTTHYDHPIYEGGYLLKDMVYLKYTYDPT